ncbi:MAG TPA: hypothetical protein VFW07_17160 [Parafilimonas sp.]|nr:hypothetical protein [Parafilimonas sp.]
MFSGKPILNAPHLVLKCFLFLVIHLSVPDLQAQIKSAGEIISKYQNVFDAPPVKIPGRVSVDAPLLGNGFSAVSIAGPPEQQVYYLARNDFWRLKSGFNESFPAVLGTLRIDIPLLKGASYRIEQDLYDALTKSVFTRKDTSVTIQSVVTATEDLLLITITNSGKCALAVNVLLEPPTNDENGIDPSPENKFPDTVISGKNIHGMHWIQRGFVKDVTIKSMAAAALKIMGETSNEFTIGPGQKAMLVCALSSSFKSANCLNAVQEKVREFNVGSAEKIQQEHLEWWHRYWSEGWVDIEDSVIEHQYYRSQYNMASCSRDPEFPPGIFGSWITQETPMWNGDYHLNYNYSAPFYALYSSNHLQQALPYEAPLIDFMPRGKYYSSTITHIANGVLYPVGIGPLGIETTRKNDLMAKDGYIKPGDVEDEGLFFGQKSNAAYCAVNLSMAFYRTYDASLAKRVYPFVRSVAVFWQHYLKMENGTYVIENDAIHEGTIGTKNPILSLGLVRMVLQTAIDMSEFLGKDKDLRNGWQEKHDHIAPYATQILDGKTVFKYSEKGTAWWPDNTLGIQHIYPAGQIGLNSDSSILQIARNTIGVMGRWTDNNGTNSFFPAAVRIGYNADTILKKLHDYSLHIYPNGFQLNNPHGIENCSTVPNAINEMMCMSNQNVLRVFEVWPKEKDASFVNIRSEGAFLVSSVIKNKLVQYVKIISEKGRTCVLQNPWPGKELRIKSNKKEALKLSGARIVIHTLPGEELVISVED